MSGRFHIDKVGISITNIDHATDRILKRAEKRMPGYVCVTNVRATYIGNHDENYCRILNNSFLTVPDGKPIEWYARLSKHKQVGKTSGPDLFTRICDLTENTEYTHFFYGSSPKVIALMKRNILREWPNLKIAGAVSPPFKPVEELATDEIVNKINKHKPTFVWVGLGAPKQEKFIDLIIKRIENSILIGVGLVFDYQAKTVKRAPVWMQKNGLEWCYRFIQQPLYSRRSLIAFRYFISLITKKWIKKIFQPLIDS
jgi:N-acetylglucosaminyldiphosphoundecaprenol N-acetyl-beta-D-mannosaminyltransferase